MVTGESTSQQAVVGDAAPEHQFSSPYEFFILVLTVMSLCIMALELLPLDDAVSELLLHYQNAICVVFLVDFCANLWQAPTKRTYFIDQRGWLDLIGSIPTFGFFNLSGLLRLARLSRLFRILRVMRRQNQEQLLAEVLKNRGQYAVAVTLLVAFLVLVVSSIVVLMFESHSSAANITTGGDALWWAIVTLTTVGYGDKYPVTEGGRLTATFVMLAGVGIIGSLAGILSSLLVPPPPVQEKPVSPEPLTLGLEQELAAIRGELAALRASIEHVEHA